MNADNCRVHQNEKLTCYLKKWIKKIVDINSEVSGMSPSQYSWPQRKKPHNF